MWISRINYLQLQAMLHKSHCSISKEVLVMLWGRCLHPIKYTKKKRGKSGTFVAALDTNKIAFLLYNIIKNYPARDTYSIQLKGPSEEICNILLFRYAIYHSKCIFALTMIMMIFLWLLWYDYDDTIYCIWDILWHSQATSAGIYWAYIWCFSSIFLYVCVPLLGDLDIPDTGNIGCAIWIDMRP